MTICLSPGGSTIYDSPRLSDELMVGTQDGVVRLSNDAGNWSLADHTLTGHHVCALIQEPRSGRYIAGTHDAGIAVSDDGAQWRFSNVGLDITNVFSLAAPSTDGRRRIYAGTEPAAIFFSDDLGESWHALKGFETAPNRDTWMFPAPPFIGHVKTFTFDPENPDRFYVCVEQGGLYGTTDGGDSWTEYTAGMPNDAHRAVIHPTRPDRIYLCNGFFFNRSDDGGTSWFEMANQTSSIGYADALLYHPNKPETMIVSGAFATPDTWMQGSANSHVSRTRDGGDHWEDARNGFPEEILGSFEAGCIESSGDVSRAFLGTTHGEVWLSEDEGDNWHAIITGLPSISKCFHADMILGRMKLDPDNIQVPPEIREQMERMAAR